MGKQIPHPRFARVRNDIDFWLAALVFLVLIFRIAFGRSFDALLRFVLQRDGQVRGAGFGGVDEGGAFAVSGAGAEEEALLGAVGKSGEAGFAVDVGADFEVEFAGVHESVGDVDFDVGGVDCGAGGVGDGEVGRAGAGGSVDYGDGFGVDG
jgi:hypothetical protein